MPTALLLCAQDLGRWRQGSQRSATPGGELPYGLARLGEWFELEWSDGQRRGLWAARPSVLAGGLVRRLAPGLSGTAGAFAGWTRLRRADVALSIFENAGLGLGRVQAVARHPRPPHVMVVCWLAEDCSDMSPRELASVARSLRSTRRLLVFSANQVRILNEAFDLPEDRVQVVPFGVDTDYYSPERVAGTAPGGGGLVAVGSDSRRDYRTLFEAVRLAKLPLTLACQPRNLSGLEVPAEVSVVSAFGDDYRRLLHSADLVVTPTTAPAYPSGQSVVLEAMAMGRATLTTDSPAMRDYVREGVDGALVPARDAAALADAMTMLMADAPRRDALAEAGRARVVHDFGLDSMWRAIAHVMLGQLPARSW